MKKLSGEKIAGQFSVEIASQQLLFTWNIVFGGLNRVKTKSEFLNRILKFHAES